MDADTVAAGHIELGRWSIGPDADVAARINGHSLFAIGGCACEKFHVGWNGAGADGPVHGKPQPSAGGPICAVKGLRKEVADKISKVYRTGSGGGTPSLPEG